MALEPTFNCELEQGDNTMYGTVIEVVRLSDERVRVEVEPLKDVPVKGPRFVYLKADGVTRVRTGVHKLT